MPLPRLPSRFFGRVRFVVVVSTGLTLATLPASAVEPPESAQVKAAFVFNFFKFVEWPAQAKSQTPRGIGLCVIGNRPLDGNLSLLAGRKVGARVIDIIHNPSPASASPCHIAYIADLDSSFLRDLQRVAPGAPTLTVSDQRGFIDEGGMIELRIIDGKVRFDINLLVARAANLQLSSQLLQLANRVVQ